MAVARPRRVARGVELFPARTPTLPPATHTNSYAVGEREVLLVEPATPFDDERRDWLTWARAFEGQGRRVVGILLTHHHDDHIGGASFFADELGVPLLGAIPLQPGLAESADAGRPVLVAEPASPAAAVLRAIAERVHETAARQRVTLPILRG